MLKKLLIAAVIVTSNFGISTTSEAAQYDSKNYCCRDSYCGDYYGEQNSDGEHCGRGGYCYGGGRGCR